MSLAFPSTLPGGFWISARSLCVVFGIMKHRGLCMTCENAPTCMFPKDPDWPVFFCELFESRVSLPVEAAGVDSASAIGPSTIESPGLEVPPEFKGLCCDCSNRSTCTFMKPEGGVWHCEEYQIGLRETTAPPLKKKAVGPDRIRRIVEGHRGARGELIAILEEIQSEEGYLPEEALREVAGSTGRSMVDIFGVATFYRSFSLRPRGKHLICACLGTACHVRGAPMVVEEFERQLGIKAGETTPDGRYTLDTVNCLGACALGPVVVVKGEYFPNVSTTKVKRILKATEPGGPAARM